MQWKLLVECGCFYDPNIGRVIFQTKNIKIMMLSGPKKISQVKVCHLVTDLMQNIVARLVESPSHLVFVSMFQCWFIVECWAILCQE